jgi:hypothetical protein
MVQDENCYFTQSLGNKTKLQISLDILQCVTMLQISV